MGIETATLLLLGGGIAAGAAAGGAFSKKPKLPKQTAVNETKTAEALPQDSEAAKKNRQRKASLLTKDFGTPVLGKPGLLGI
jgi:hypothetical protein